MKLIDKKYIPPYLVNASVINTAVHLGHVFISRSKPDYKSGFDLLG